MSVQQSSFATPTMDVLAQQAELEPIEQEAASGFDMLEPLFTNLDATSAFRPGIVHDDSELSDSSSESGPAHDAHNVEHRPLNTTSVSVAQQKLHIDLAKFASSSDIAEAVSRYRRCRADIVRQVLAVSVVLVEQWHKLTQEGTSPFRLGLIGAGTIGRALLRGLIDSGLRSGQILVSTRRPETVGAAVPACTDNGRVFDQCDLVLVCVLPNQLGAVAADYRACTAPRALLAVLSSSVPLGKLQSMFGRETILHLAAVLPVNKKANYYEDLAANIQTQLIQRSADRLNDSIIKRTADIHDRILIRIRGLGD